MTQPKPTLPTVELIPLHGAMVTQQPMTLDVLVRITPPAVTLKADRVPLNLSLAIDRSGSMQGQKMHYAREAARFAVENLLPCDGPLGRSLTIASAWSSSTTASRPWCPVPWPPTKTHC